MTAYPSRAIMDGAEPVRRYRDVLAPPDDFAHTRGSECACRPVVESGPAGDVVVHRHRGAGDPVEQGESDL